MICLFVCLKPLLWLLIFKIVCIIYIYNKGGPLYVELVFEHGSALVYIIVEEVLLRFICLFCLYN